MKSSWQIIKNIKIKNKVKEEKEKEIKKFIKKFINEKEFLKKNLLQKNE